MSDLFYIQTFWYFMNLWAEITIIIWLWVWLWTAMLATTYGNSVRCCYRVVNWHCMWLRSSVWWLKVMRKQWTGTGAIRRQIPISKPKWKITKITNRHIQRKQMAKRVGSYFPKGGHQANQTELKVSWTNIRWNITENLTPKTGNREPHQNHHLSNGQ